MAAVLFFLNAVVNLQHLTDSRVPISQAYT